MKTIMSYHKDTVPQLVPVSLRHLLQVFHEHEEEHNRSVLFNGVKIALNDEATYHSLVTYSSNGNDLASLLAQLSIVNVSCSWQLDEREIAQRYVSCLRQVVSGERLIVLAAEGEQQKQLFNQVREWELAQPKFHRLPIKLTTPSLPAAVREKLKSMVLSYVSMEISWFSLTKLIPLILNEDYYEIGFTVSPPEVTDTLVESMVEFLTEGSTSELRPLLEFIAQGSYLFTFLPDSWRLALLAPKIRSSTNAYGPVPLVRQRNFA